MMFTVWNNGNRNGVLIRKNQNKEVVITQQRGTGFRTVPQSIKFGGNLQWIKECKG